MPIVHLADRSLVLVSGADAEHLLQNILTTDLDKLGEDEAKPGALLTPQGKILFDFLISRDGSGGFRLDCRADVVDDFIRRLMLYRLRAKAEISKPDQTFVSVSWQGDSSTSQDDSSELPQGTAAVRDARFAGEPSVRRIYAPIALGEPDPSLWHALRIAHGIAESGPDYALGDAFPHDVLLDQSDGVGFTKGCYVGQEVVSRMQHRGTARRRVLLVAADSALSESGADILAGDRSIGTLGSVSGTDGLAIVRIDRVKDALDTGLPITAGGVAVSLTIPAWAKFTFPQDQTATGDA
ncbi:folate-binding protein [Pseudaminobacter arsenicus]|uniref:Folate-binding protein n=1 Tax=Borborobacter arsenicus TaxID=1851146 RepID=A0A432V2M7_9HYPH|nr:folate-binding protein YgfZ [Pseudaminobacter arsenicus]RUM96396.1 folate-binding protein [Pseudaminobacter arsenicus]